VTGPGAHQEFEFVAEDESPLCLRRWCPLMRPEQLLFQFAQETRFSPIHFYKAAYNAPFSVNVTGITQPPRS
jgi:hypothetical protein